MKPTAELIQVRIDKWLWAARFFKTRSLAAAAVKSGKIRIQGNRAKASRLIKVADQLLIQRGEFSFDIVIDQLAEKRVSAKLAESLFTESDKSIKQREDLAESIRLERKAGTQYGGRPSKQDRRNLLRIQGKV